MTYLVTALLILGIACAVVALAACRATGGRE